MKRFDMTQRADDRWSIYGSFGQVQGQVQGNENCFYHEENGCRVCSLREEDENGVVCQTGTIVNTSDKPIQVNYATSKFLFDGGEYRVYTQTNSWQNESTGAWQPLVTAVTAQTLGARSSFGAAPFFVLWNEQASRGRAFHILADCAWKYTVARTPYFSGEAMKVEVEIGINDCNFSMELAPGEELKLPEILYYDVLDPVDMDAYKLHNYINKRFPIRKMPVIFNTWLYKFEKINFENVASQIKRAAQLGVDYFVTDAGWYGEGNFWECRGDWMESPNGSYGGRMKELSDLVRANGMGFGFWLEIESAGKNAKALAEHPDFYFQYDDMILFDFANPEACDYIVDVVCGLVKTYNAAFIKFDFNQDTRLDSRQCALIKYGEGFRGVISRIREAFPDLYMENCAGGGLRMGLDNCRDFDSFWYSDNQSPYEGMRIYKDTLRRMPPQRIERWASIQSVGGIGEVYMDNPVADKIISNNDATWTDVRGVFPSFLEGFLLGSPMGFSCDLNQISDAHFGRLQALIAQFKADREFWENAVCRIVSDTETVLVLQYSDMALSRVEVMVFTWRRRQNNICVYPKVAPGKTYRVNGKETCSAAELDRYGIDVPLQGNYQMIRLSLRESSQN